jgi:hypothetical protein
MRKTYLWIILSALVFVPSCEKDFDKGEQIYFNSFESNSDIDGWEGYAFNFSNDAPKHGGKRSLSVSGGCLIPHARYNLSPQNTDCNIIIRFWGKNLSNGGGVALSANKAGGGHAGFDISDKDWTLYESQDMIFCPANSNLTLELISGGIASSSMLIDKIDIRRVEINP